MRHAIVFAVLAITIIVGGCGARTFDETYRLLLRHPKNMARVGYEQNVRDEHRLVGHGKIVTNPAGATVTIKEKKTGNSILSGHSPLEWEFKKKTWRVVIIIEKEGYETATRYPSAIDEYGYLFVELEAKNSN